MIWMEDEPVGFFSKPEIIIKNAVSSNTKDSLPAIHIIHGIHSGSDEGPASLAPYYVQKGFRVRIWDYGEVWAINSRFKNPYVVDALMKEVKEHDILVGHSNGGAIIAAALDRGLRVGGVVLINPALNRSRRFPSTLPWYRIYYNGGDVATKAGKWFRRLSPISWFKRHPFGEMGRNGPDYEDPRGELVDAGSTSWGTKPRVWGHSDFVKPDTLAGSWGEFDSSQTYRKVTE